VTTFPPRCCCRQDSDRDRSGETRHRCRPGNGRSSYAARALPRARVPLGPGHPVALAFQARMRGKDTPWESKRTKTNGRQCRSYQQCAVRLQRRNGFEETPIKPMIAVHGHVSERRFGRSDRREQRQSEAIRQSCSSPDLRVIPFRVELAVKLAWHPGWRNATQSP
jgi:hypothetical protein